MFARDLLKVSVLYLPLLLTGPHARRHRELTHLGRRFSGSPWKSHMPTQFQTKSQPASPKAAIAAILAVSIVATLFLFWLIYVHPATDAASVQLTFLPALCALFNGLAATALLIGYTFIRSRRIPAIARPCLQPSPSPRSFFLPTSLTTTSTERATYPGHSLIRPSISASSSATSPSASSGPALHPDYVFLSRSPADSPSPQNRPLDFPHLALRLHHRRHCPRHASRRPSLNPQ